MSHSGEAIAFLSSPLSRFRPWRSPDTGRSPQADFLHSAQDHRYRIFRAGNRCGKTEVGVVDVLLRCFGWHSYAHRKPPVHGWVVCLDWDTVGQVMWPKFKKYLPMDRIRIGWQKRTGVEIPESIVFPNGSTIVFKSAESQREKFQGKDLDFAWIDEEVDGGIVQEIEARLLDRGGDLIVTLTPVARKAWVADLERKTSNGRPLTRTIRASMRDAAAAGILNRDAVESYLESLPERQRKVREYGDFSALEGLVYPEYSEDTHVLRPRENGLFDAGGKFLYQWPLPKEWRCYGGIDFGFAVPTAVPLVIEDPFLERWLLPVCYYASNIRISRWAEFLKNELPPLAAPLAADHQAFERQELNGAGVQTMPAVKDVVPGLEAVERAFKLRPDGYPRLMLVMDDVNVAKHPLVGRYDAFPLHWELTNYRYPDTNKKKDQLVNQPRDLPVKKDDHACDALRYLVRMLERRGGIAAPELPPVENKLEPVSQMMPTTPWRK